MLHQTEADSTALSMPHQPEDSVALGITIRSAMYDGLRSLGAEAARIFLLHVSTPICVALWQIIIAPNKKLEGFSSMGSAARMLFMWNTYRAEHGFNMIKGRCAIKKWARTVQFSRDILHTFIDDPLILEYVMRNFRIENFVTELMHPSVTSAITAFPSAIYARATRTSFEDSSAVWRWGFDTQEGYLSDLRDALPVDYPLDLTLVIVWYLSGTQMNHRQLQRALAARVAQGGEVAKVGEGVRRRRKRSQTANIVVPTASGQVKKRRGAKMPLCS